MENENLKEYYGLFGRLVDAMTKPGYYDRDELLQLIGEVCELYHLAKVTTEFYKSPSHEKTGQGDCRCGYDNGKGSKVLLSTRIVTKTNAILIGTIYRDENEPPLTNDQLSRLDLLMRAVMSFISRYRLQEAVERLGYYDDSGYPNIRSFLRYIDQVNDQGKLGGYVAILYNLRHFTLINREIGMENGDTVIWNHFHYIKKVIGESGILCRLGGDSFLAIFQGNLLDQILKTLQGTPILYDTMNEKRVNVSACVGVFQIPEDYEVKNVGSIMDKIMPASIAAKNNKAGTVVFYSEQLLQEKDRQMRLQRLFPEALERKEFLVFYQPKVDVITGEIVGAEALCRWMRGGRIVPPMEFIPLLEQNTSICQLDFYVLDRVCKDIRKWLDEGKKVVRISVNYSRKHMMDPDLLEHTLRIIEENQVPHEYIEIELTETTTDVEFTDLKRVVGGLQQEGIHTSVDDFGMGYSSLNLIREIPWNVLKIDKSFLPVGGDNLDVTTGRMYRHVVALAKDLGLECITEGVETKDQIRLLRENGCRIAQGYHFDKPLPVEEFEKRLDMRFYELPTAE